MICAPNSFEMRSTAKISFHVLPSNLRIIVKVQQNLRMMGAKGFLGQLESPYYSGMDLPLS
jgi:hypothetical protein